MIAREHRFIPLIQDFDLLGHFAKVGALGIIFFIRDRDLRPNRVADENGFGKTKAFVPIGKRCGIDDGCSQADANGEGHRAVGDALAEGCGLGELGIKMMREEIAAVPCVDNEIRFGNRPAVGFANIAKGIVCKVKRLRHWIPVSDQSKSTTEQPRFHGQAR